MTHINAYFADVEDAKAKVAFATSELELAEQRLEEKKAEDGWEEPEEAEPEVGEEPEPKEESKVQVVPARRK